MAGIHIDPNTVPNDLKTFIEKYNEFFRALKDLNIKFADLNSYWTGDRYKKTMQAWNDVVPNLNKFLKDVAADSGELNRLLKEYTTADTAPIVINPADVLSLNTCTISTKTDIDIDPVILNNDLVLMQKSLDNACGKTKEMITTNKAADWSDGGRLDNTKNDITTNLNSILANLHTLKTGVSESLSASSESFGSIQKA